MPYAALQTHNIVLFTLPRPGKNTLQPRWLNCGHNSVKTALLGNAGRSYAVCLAKPRDIVSSITARAAAPSTKINTCSWRAVPALRM